MKSIGKFLALAFLIALSFTACNSESEPEPEPEILGCTDPDGLNYNPNATKDDGSCTYDVLGCMDETANNYNPNATKDDGSCTYDIAGCMDPNASNYNPEATVDDGSCVYASETITAMPAVFEQKVLLEYYTGSWCGFCTDGQVMLDAVLEQYPDKAIAAIPHVSDPMEIPEYSRYMSAELDAEFAPGAAVNRSPYSGSGEVYINRGEFMDATRNILTNTPTNTIGIAIETELSGGELSVVSHVGFLEDSEKQYKLFVLVLEDNVIRNEPGYHQSNYSNNSPGHHYYQAGDPIVGYAHRNVVRDYAHDVDGEAIPQEEVAANNVYKKTNKFDISAYRSGEVSVVAFVVEAKGKPIDSPIVNVQTAKAGFTKNWD